MSPSACTYLPPRKKTCTHPCKLVTRKNKPQCRTKYLRKGKKKGKKGKKTLKRTKGKKATKTSVVTESAPIVQEETSTEEPVLSDEPVITETVEPVSIAEETPVETIDSSDPLKSMVNMFSKKVSFSQNPV